MNLHRVQYAAHAAVAPLASATNVTPSAAVAARLRPFSSSIRSAYAAALKGGKESQQGAKEHVLEWPCVSVRSI